MATINKTSVREEVDRLKHDFEKLCSDGKVSSETRVVETWEMEAIESLLQAPSMHVDETSFRVEGKNHWIHVYSSGEQP